MAKAEVHKEEIHVPGTMVLVFIFLGWFVFFYFLGWWFLSQAWVIQ
mgnify:CR=1 FL=1|jgi:hypothetical protein